MKQENYFSVENGREIMLDRFHDLQEAIGFAERNAEAEEIFAFTQGHELAGCVWSRKSGTGQ